MNLHEQQQQQILDEIFHLREYGDFSQFKKILYFVENDSLHLEGIFH